MKKIERDTMPLEVATEMATAPWRAQSNRERKMYLDARYKAYISEQQRKPLAEKLANRVKTKPLAWLGREAHRLEKRRRGVQLKYEKLMGLKSNPLIERLIAAINLQAGQMDLFLDSLAEEIQSRTKIARGVWTEGVLGSPLCRETRSWVSGRSYCSRRTEFPRWVPTRQVLDGV